MVVVSLKADRRRFGAIHSPFQLKTLTEEVQRQRGKRADNEHACVSVIEGGETSQEVVVMSLTSAVDGF